jgi:beta-lactamase regulating signal transducer with metallopeptidase domain/Tfp pilus assembly protein PilF
MNGLGHALTLALMHFVWQGAAIALLLWLVLAILRSANSRYAACCAAMALMAMAPVFMVWTESEAPAARTEMAVFAPAQIPAGVSPAAVAKLTGAPRRDWLALAQSWVLPLWAMGVAVFAVRMGWGCGQVVKLRRGGSAGDAALMAAAERMALRVGLDRKVSVLVSETAHGPSVLGCLRPVILLPACALSGLNPEQLEAVLAHELAHIRRYDALVNLAQMAVETVLFYHPAVWLVSRWMRQERELCCDDLAVRACSDALCYARALTVLERLRTVSLEAAPGAAAGSLRYRIERIVGVRRQEYGAPRGAAVVAAALAIVGLAVELHVAKAQQLPASEYLRQGDLLLREGRNDDALRMYAAGEQQDPARKSTYEKRSIEVLLREGKRAEAAEIGARILKDNPLDTDALGLQGAFLVDAGKPREAVEVLEPLVKEVPKNPVLHLDLGRAYEALKRYDAATEEFQKALDLRPDFKRAVLAYANLLIEQNQFGTRTDSIAEARRLLEPLRAGNPTSREIWAEFAALGRAEGDYQAASKDYLRIYELQPGNERWLDLAARALIDAKQPDQAMDLMRAESQKHPDRLDLAMGLGDVAKRVGQFEVALDAYHRMTSSSNIQAQAAGYWSLALLYESRQDWQNALDNVDRAIAIQPSNQYARELREKILHERPAK